MKPGATTCAVVVEECHFAHRPRQGAGVATQPVAPVMNPVEAAAFYGPVLMLAAHDGKMVVWLPWTDTEVTQSLAGFPDVSTLEFTGWCIALRKVMISAS